MPRRPLPLILLAALAVGLGGGACGPREGDLNLDGAVDVLDLVLVTGCLGQDPATAPGCGPADADGDGDVDLDDRNLVVSQLDGLACNRDPSICDRPYDQVAYATSHNAFSATDDGFYDQLTANHTASMREQLRDGIRGLMLDTHYYEGSTWLCHSYCQLGGTNLGRIDLAEGLGWIRDFLDQNPAEIVTIIFEAYVSEADTAAAFAASGLDAYVHAQTPGEAWPTLREMIRNGRRLVVLTDDSGASLPWHHYVWTHAFETDYDFSLQDGLEADLERLFGISGCARNRGTEGADLFILNHFLTAVSGSPIFADLVNHEPEFTERALLCGDFHGRIPNFPTVDYHHIGDVLDVARALNAAYGP